jgi:hypothetical protein
MTEWRRRVAAVSSVIVGVFAGGAIALSADRFADDLPERPRPSSEPSPTPQLDPPLPPAEAPERTRLLAWAPGGLPGEAARAARSIGSVSLVSEVVAGLDWITRTTAADGQVLERSSDGYAIPFEAAVVDPRGYAAFARPSERDLIDGLSRGEVLLSQTSARLRGAEPGARLRFADGRALTVTGVVRDETAGGYEGLIAGPVPASWQRTYPFLLLRGNGRLGKAVVRRALRPVLESGQVMRVREQGETPFLRYGDAVMPQMLVKEAFGEFAARRAGNTITIDERWRRRNIRVREVPVLGTVTCHRSLLPQLEAALEEVAAAGLAHAIDPGDYGGCYSPRFLSASPGGRLSHHSWGIAIDIDVGENAFGTRPDQDPRVVEIFERHGFTWGGRWLLPDGMHFEWTHF